MICEGVRFSFGKLYMIEHYRIALSRICVIQSSIDDVAVSFNMCFMSCSFIFNGS